MGRFRKSVLPVVLVVSGALLAEGAFADDRFEFGGYLRAGTGRNTVGGDQVCFQAPGAGAKYRLGNECEIFSELAFRYKAWEGENDSFLNINTLVSFATEGEAGFEGDNPDFTTGWIQGGNLVGGPFEGASFWAGKRFYRRHDIHINDFFFWGQGGQVGGGIEDFNLGFGQLAVAFFGDNQDTGLSVVATNADGTPVVDANGNEVRISPQGAVIQNNDVATSRLDTRIYGIETNPNGSLTVGFDYRIADEDREDFDGHSGWWLTLDHFQSDFISEDGFNEFAIQYAQGAASPMGDNSDSGANNSNWTFRVVNSTVLDTPVPWFSAMIAAVYERRVRNDSNSSGSQDQTWISLGARPIFHFTRHLSLALEVGHDRVDPQNGSVRKLNKFTIAPILMRNRGFFKRPELRMFLTYADWNKAAQRNNPFTNGTSVSGDGSAPFGKTHGWTYGIQSEAWW